jgi:hypothetical protein
MKVSLPCHRMIKNPGKGDVYILTQQEPGFFQGSLR